mgnify:FL=1|tara:strand:+ start:384 stop:842 length:459 start_codon:yes stop_codon:yes gene_type:complete
MGVKNRNFLKKENRDFNNVLDSVRLNRREVKAKTADYTVTTEDFSLNTLFTNRGASAGVVFTLPAPSADLAGCQIDILGLAAQAITASSATADTLVVPSHAGAVGEATADSIALVNTTAIGGKLSVLCDGTNMIALSNNNISGSTSLITITT